MVCGGELVCSGVLLPRELVVVEVEGARSGAAVRCCEPYVVVPSVTA